VLRGGNLVVTEEGIREGVRQVLLPLWNTWYFFSLYANATGYEAKRSTASTDVLDRYLLAKTRDLVEAVTADLDALDSTLAAAKLRDFADVLTNWYVRRSRDRFWAGVEESGAGSEAFDTLFTVLETFTRVAAPLLPLVSERIWKDLTGGRSVHLTDWPEADEFPADDALADAMDRIRAISSTALSLRKQAGRRVRLPLASLTVVAANAEALRPFEGILRDELNVKSVELVELQDDSAARYGITSRLTVNARAAGPRLGKQVQQVIQAARAGDWTEIDGVVTVGGIELAEGEYDLVLETASGGDGTAALALLAGGGFVLLDTATTPELEAEGLARDIIRAVQDTRKAAGLDVSDRIRLDLAFEHEDDVRALDLAVDVDIAAETLALAVQLSAAESSSGGDAPGDGGLGDGASDDRAVFEQRFGAGQFANAGAFTVGVTKLS
jgi:isoleucyl-tRNA synthetase